MGAAPDLFPSGESEHIARRRHAIKRARDDQWIALHLAQVAGVIFPRHAKLADVVPVHLRQRGVMHAALRAEILAPIGVRRRRCKAAHADEKQKRKEQTRRGHHGAVEASAKFTLKQSRAGAASTVGERRTLDPNEIVESQRNAMPVSVRSNTSMS